MIKAMSAGYILSSLLNMLEKAEAPFLMPLLASVCSFDVVELTSPPKQSFDPPGSEQIISVLTNQLTRGLPTNPSVFLERQFGSLYNSLFRIYEADSDIGFKFTLSDADYQQFLHALCIVDPQLDEVNPDVQEFYQSVPAMQFFKAMPQWMQQVLQPERHFQSNMVNSNSEFVRQRVDFAIETPSGCKNVIEVDGGQHNERSQTIQDTERDAALAKAGWQIDRISTSENIVAKAGNFLTQVQDDEYLRYVETNFKSPLLNSPEGVATLELALGPLAVARIQRLLLEYMLSGILSLKKAEWKIVVFERDIGFTALALNDLVQWFNAINVLTDEEAFRPHICLHIVREKDSPFSKQAFVKCPNITISVSEADLLSSFTEVDLCIDFSMLRRSGLELQSAIQKIYPLNVPLAIVRSSHSLVPQRQIQFSRPIRYNIEEDETVKEAALEFFLQNIFRKQHFREGQLEIIKRALERKNVIGLLPTGAGKSLCYQLATLLQPCVSIVVEPIKSLMHDQYRNLKKMGIDAVANISSDLNTTEREYFQNRFQKGEFQFVLITPERFQIEKFRQILETFSSANPVGYGVIDEAHCVSEWGHDFRPSYLTLAKSFKTLCCFEGQSPPIYALTATASSAVLRDIRLDLGISEAEEDGAIITPGTLDRSELEFRLYQTPTANKFESLKHIFKELAVSNNCTTEELFIVDGANTRSGLIFCPHVNKSDVAITTVQAKIAGHFSFAERQGHNLFDVESEIPYCSKCGRPMRQRQNRRDKSYFYGCSGYPACRFTRPFNDFSKIKVYRNSHIYAGKVPNHFSDPAWQEYKMKAQEEFTKNLVPLMITTKSFGMGIDIPNIRYTIHYNIPPSIEAFYQEAGRAGRDRKNAVCALIFSDENAQDANARLNPDLRADEVWEIKDPAWEEQSDVHRMLFFQQNSFKGQKKEITNLKQIVNFHILPQLKVMPDDSSKDVVIEALETEEVIKGKKKTIKNDAATEKVLYRLQILGVIDFYTIDFSTPKRYCLRVNKRSDLYYASKLYDYLRLRKENFRAKHQTSDLFLAEIVLNRPTIHTITALGEELIEFVYSTIEPQRRQSLANMVDAARSETDEEFRYKVLRYLSPAEELAWLFKRFPESSYLNEWLEILDYATDFDSTSKLFGMTQRTLESYPNHTGLRHIAAALRLQLPKENPDAGVADFRAANRLLKDGYQSAETAKIIRSFVEYHANYTIYEDAKIEIAKLYLLLDEESKQTERAEFLALLADESMRRVGQVVLLNGVAGLTKKLVKKVRGFYAAEFTTKI